VYRFLTYCLIDESIYAYLLYLLVELHTCANLLTQFNKLVVVAMIHGNKYNLFCKV